jgi:hypothetical protein
MLQFVALAAEYEPAGHATHGDDDLESVSAVPATHVAQLVAPYLAYVPAPHAMHGVDGLLSVSAVPARQALQLVDPAGA